MLVLPDWIEVKVVSPTGKPIANVLVSVAALIHGGYYFGDPMGLTNERGLVRITGDQIQRDFENNQLTFPMDLKVALRDCDAALDVIVRGNAEFRDLKASIQASTLVRPDVKDLYHQARNEGFESSRLRVDLSKQPKHAEARVVLAAARVA